MARIKNQTKNCIIAEDYRLCKSIFKKASGLMFSGKRALVFDFKKEKKIPLHMMFVFFPIDVFFLNRNKKVVEIKRDFRPFSFYSPKKKAMYIIELPKSRRYKKEIAITQTGDILSF